MSWLSEKLDGYIFAWTWRFGGPKDGDRKLVEHDKDGMGSKDNTDGRDKGGQNNGRTG